MRHDRRRNRHGWEILILAGVETSGVLCLALFTGLETRWQAMPSAGIRAQQGYSSNGLAPATIDILFRAENHRHPGADGGSIGLGSVVMLMMVSII